MVSYAYLWNPVGVNAFGFAVFNIKILEHVLMSDNIGK